MAGKAVRLWLCVVSGMLAASGVVLSAPQENGNKLALEFSTATESRRQEMRKETGGKFYFFRYLRVVAAERGDREGRRYARLTTIEPSSDMRVVFTVDQPVSLEKARDLKENDAVAVSGSIRNLGEETNTIALAQAVIRYKDRTDPKVGKELLPEVDPTARMGNDTSSGQEVIRRGSAGK